MEPSPQNFIPDYDGLFGDKRLDKRGSALWHRLSLFPASSVRSLSDSRSEQKAYYRFLSNNKVTEEVLAKEASDRVSKLASGRHLLCIQDTCEINLSKHQGRLQPNSGLGRSDKSESLHCFKLHPGLVVDASRLSPLGYSHVKVFHRPLENPDKNTRKYQQQPIEEKESYKWVETAMKSKQTLEEADSITFIEDREGDIYEQFARVVDNKTHLLVRSRSNRKTREGKYLYEEVEQAPLAGRYTIEIPTDNRKKQYKRQATIELRFTTSYLRRPKKLPKNKGYPSSIPVTCIYVREMGNAPNPVDWKLLTTHKIETYEDALTIVEWYSARWYIEQVFRLLKKQGFGIEDTELEKGWAIRKLVVMQLTALLKIIQMKLAYADPEEGQPIDEVFEEEEIEVLQVMNEKLQGNTRKQQNMNDPNKTKWAAWVIGRLGGWKGYDSQGPPGVIILKRGLDRLSYIFEGLQLAKDVGTR